MNKIILIKSPLQDTHIMSTLVNELGFPISQAEQIVYILDSKEVCIKESDDRDKLLEAISILDTARIKYKVT